jgi:WD40 repeat protein
LVLTVHGIRTYGQWQERLGALLSQATASQTDGLQLDIRNYRYGYFTVFSFLIPWLRNLAVKQFRSHLSAIFEEGQFDRIDIVAHSFGTFLAIRGLSDLDRKYNVHIHTAILCGSVLSPDYNLSHLVGPERRIGRLVNDCGMRDAVLLLTLMIIGVGMGGRLGLHGFQGRLLTNRYFGFGHSGYFLPEGGDPDEFMRHWWLSLLLDDKPVEAGPQRSESPSLNDRVWRTLGENGASTTAMVYGMLIAVIFGSIGYFWRDADVQRFAALQQTIRGEAALAQRLFDLGESDYAVNELAQAAVMAKGYSLQKNFPEFLSTLRTINAEFNVIARLSKNKNNVVDANFDSTGTRLVTASWDGTAQLWDVPVGAPPQWRATLQGQLGQIRQAQFSPDGKTVVTTATDGSVAIWDADSGKNEAMVKAHGAGVDVLAIARDGSKFATGAENGSVFLWDFKTKNYVRLDGHSRQINAIAFSRDSKLLATASDDQTARLWNAQNGQLLQILQGHKNNVTAVSFSSDGKTLLTASIDQSVGFWSVPDGAQIGTVQNPYATSVVVDPSSRYFATAPYPFVPVVGAPAQIWDMKTRSSVATLHNDDGIDRLAFNPQVNGNQIATASDHEIRIWKPSNGSLLKIFRLADPDDKVSRVVFSPDGTMLVSTYGSGAVRLWDTRPVPATGIVDELTPLDPLFLAPDRIATISAGGSIQIRDFPSLKQESESRGNWSVVRSIALGRDNQVLLADAAFGAHSAGTWSQSATQQLGTCQLNGILDLAVLNPSGTAVAAGGDVNDKTIYLCDASTGASLRVLSGHKGAINAIAFDRSGRLLASGSSDNTVMIWNVFNEDSPRVLTGHQAAITSVAFSPDASFMVSGSLDRNAKVWDTATKQIKFTLPHEDAVSAVAVDPTSKIIATGERNGILQLWDATAGISVARFRGHSGSISNIVFSPDGNYVLSVGASDKTLRLWKIVPEFDLLKWIENVSSVN